MGQYLMVDTNTVDIQIVDNEWPGARVIKQMVPYLLSNGSRFREMAVGMETLSQLKKHM